MLSALFREWNRRLLISLISLGGKIKEAMSKASSLLFSLIFVATFLVLGSVASADQTARGFAWSSNTGWLSFSSTNCDANDDTRSEGVPAACPAAGTGMARYGVIVSGAATDVTRNFSGFAWSPHIGWVSFNQGDLAGCPVGTCSAQMVSNAVVGWSRAIGRNPGWTGWIHLANTNPVYGPLLGTDSKFRGFSWGENVIGWLKWDPNGGGVSLNSGPVGSQMRVVKNGSGTVTSVPSGINCGSDCNEPYTAGTVVTLTQTELPGYQFSSWGGAGASCGTQSTCQVTMGSTDTVVTITFNPVLEVTKSGNGTISSTPSGITCGTTCTKAYPFGTSVTLTATPDAGYQFIGWSGAGASCGTNTTCVVSVTGYTNVLAAFSSNSGMLVVSRSDNGAVASSDGRIICGATCQASYTNGSTVTLRAQPDIGFQVGSWGGAASSCGSAITCSVTVSGTTNVSVTFTRLPACRDSIDNDGDGKTDFGNDPGCTSLEDDDERDMTVTICSDGIDNDADGLTDLDDPDCGSALDMTEQRSYKCSDGIDNDLDGKCDYGAPGTSKMCLNPVTGIVSLMPVDFPECNSSTKNSETVDGTVVEY